MVKVDMKAMAASFGRNKFYFHHRYLSYVAQIIINGRTIYNVHNSFPHIYVNLYHSTQEALRIGNFAYWGDLCIFIFVDEINNDVYLLEKGGNIRNNLTFDKCIDKISVIQ